MIKITNVTIKNFLSVGAVTQAIKLNDNGLTLVLGSATDNNGGVTRNGAGKSTMLQAISFGLFGKPLTKIKIPNLVNNINGKAMLVTIEFERDGKTYRIERGKKPDIMKLYVNDAEINEQTDDAQGENKHTQEEIERLIGMSHTMFKHIVALNTFTDPFLKMSVADQRMVIEELLGITQISQRADVLKKLITQTKEGVRDQQAHISATVEANSRIDRAIDQALAKHSDWVAQNIAKLDTLAHELAMMEALDFDAEIRLFDALDQYLEKERELSSALDMAKRELALLDREIVALEQEARGYLEQSQKGVEDQVKRLMADHDRKLTFVKRHETQLTKVTAEIATVEADIAASNDSDCICCGQKLTGTDHLKTVQENLQTKLDELRTTASREQAEIESLTRETAGVLEEIEKLKADDAVRAIELRRKSDEMGETIGAMMGSRHAFEDTIATSAEAMSAIGAKPVVNFKSRDDVYRTKQARDALERELVTESEAQNPFDDQVVDLRSALQIVNYDTINELTELQKHQEFLLKLLTGKDSFIRKRIIDQNLSYLNSRLNYYLDKLGLPHAVQFQSDLSVDITLLGRDFDFEQLSRGEMNRVIMATSWSFRDVWESMNTSLNLIWLDELIDSGMDGSGAEAALGILKGMARDRNKNVFLISHREELVGRIDRTLWVRKENGFTTLDQDESSN